ncbi:lipoate-protein ligase A [Listeria floridensis FSL S10-1187]|uniref:Lipoate-protein ligase A n=1 Tax=Listeria floridensis FSL S10-1187 TaxID=1265817 RepID=A0ABP3B026_9LIST|nr:lipoate-protein ligase A [Listeria floridensis FSL S10-1187]
MTLLEGSLLKQDKWRFIDQTTLNPSFSALESYATDDTLCRTIGKKASPPTVRAWVHEKTVSIGIQDTKLPNLEAGIAFFKTSGLSSCATELGRSRGRARPRCFESFDGASRC